MDLLRRHKEQASSDLGKERNKQRFQSPKRTLVWPTRPVHPELCQFQHQKSCVLGSLSVPGRPGQLVTYQAASARFDKKQMEVWNNGLHLFCLLSPQILVPQPLHGHSTLSDKWTSRQWCPVLKKEPGVYSALLTTEAFSGLGGQMVEGKSFVQSSHKTETKRNIWNRKQWPLWHDSQRERQWQRFSKAEVQGPRGLRLTLNTPYPACLLSASPEHLFW